MHHAHYQASSAGAQALAGQSLARSTGGRPTDRPAGQPRQASFLAFGLYSLG